MSSIFIIGSLILFIIVLLLVGISLRVFKYMGIGVIKLTIGALLLFFINIIGQQMAIHIPINLFTSCISGFLGIPGIIALVIIKRYIIF